MRPIADGSSFRTEYVSPELEFVIENLDISSVELLPGRAHITTLADMEIDQQSADKDPQTVMKGHTRIRLQGVQFTLKDVSFYYHDKTGSAGPDTFTGILDVHLPERGIDLDLALLMVPQGDAPKAQKKRTDKQGYFEIKYISIDLSEKMQLSARDTNHSILMSVFKPIFRSRFESTLEKALTEQLRFALDFTNQVAWDVSRRKGVFEDTGMSSGASYAAAIWSELGYLRQQPGPFTGWQMTGTGIIKDDERTDNAFAMGAEPQILGGEKHGPMGKFKDSIGEKAAAAAPDADKKAEQAESKVQGAVKEGVQKARTFKELTQDKSQQEQQKPGWRSVAFDELANW
jgi:hypothetical protein